MARLVRKPEAQVGRSEKIGDSADGVVERRIVIGHERSPIETTHNDLRCAVEALSGGLPLTIYAERLESVRLGSDNFSGELTNSRDGAGDAEKRPSVNVGGWRGWRFKKDTDETERRGTHETSASCALLARRWRQRTAGKTLRGKELAPQVGLEPTTLRLTAERLVAASRCNHKT